MAALKHKIQLLLVLLVIQVANVVQAKEWVTELLVKAGDYSYKRYFGVDFLGTDGYDADLDVTCPPFAPVFYSYFHIDTPPFSLCSDIRASIDDSITWRLKIINATGLIDTIAWDPLSLPNDGDFILADTFNMKSSDRVVYAGNQTLAIRYISIDQGYEYVDNSEADVFSIAHSYSNPVHSGVFIRYNLMVEGFVSLRIYDIGGVLVTTLVNELQIPGIYTVHWNGVDSTNEKVNSGIYFYRFKIRSVQNQKTFPCTKKLILFR